MLFSASPADRASVPVALRRPAAVVAALAALVLGTFAVRYWGASSPSRVDGRLDAAVDSLGSAQRWFLRHAAALGSPPLVVAMALILAVLCVVLGRRRLAVLAVLGPALTGGATSLLKPIIGRTIDGGLAYPSGHTGGATAVGIVIALLLVSLLPVGRVLAALLIAACTLLVGGGVGLAVVVTGIHYPTDAVGGFCTAVAVVLSTALMVERVADGHLTTGN